MNNIYSVFSRIKVAKERRIVHQINTPPVSFNLPCNKKRPLCEWYSGISQDELGRRVFVNNIHISNIETGKKAPSIDLLIELANALEVSADDLLVDSLAHPSSTADTVLHQLLLDCNDVEEKVLVELVKYMKTVLYRLGI